MNNMFPRPRFWVEAASQIKKRYTAFGEMLVYLLLSFLAIMAQSTLTAIPMSGWIMQNKSNELMEAFEAGELSQSMLLELMKQMPEWMTVVSLLAGATLGLAAIIYCRSIQKRSLSSMGLCGKHRSGECVLGLAVGAALAAAVIALGVAAGGYRLQIVQPSGKTLLLLCLMLLGCVVYGSSLELLTRGYFAPALGAGRPVAVALLLSTIASGMLQNSSSLFSLSMANELLLGLLLGLWVLKRGSLWGACALHAAWIFTESFFFDVAPADAHSGLCIYTVDADLYRPLLSGGEYGPANSICATVVLLAAIAVVLALRGRNSAEPQDQPPADVQQTNFL